MLSCRHGRPGCVSLSPSGVKGPYGPPQQFPIRHTAVHREHGLNAGAADREAWQARLRRVRERSRLLTEGLSPEDQQLQSMPDASPTKWHLAHTTWFYETLLLAPHWPGYQVFHPGFAVLFNSYYEALGPRHPRPQRGLLSRPSLHEVWAYRHHVDEALHQLITRAEEALWARCLPTLALGLHHEEQHQELMLTDLKHAFSLNPLMPAYRPEDVGTAPDADDVPGPAAWREVPGGRCWVGHGGEEFAFDNELPRHEVLLRPFQIASRPVSNAQYQAFIADGGYRDPAWWLSDGWAAVQAQGWHAPAYWLDGGAEADAPVRLFTLHGPRALVPDEPVSHLSYYEADAYARWAGARLPSEFEWEVALAGVLSARKLDAEEAWPPPCHPRPPRSGTQGLGEVWEWTASAYAPYPGFRPASGAAAEYNGKFMVSQLVLRGGSCLTPPGHARATYRNFFPPATRWQCAGLRLAKDAT